MVGKFIKTFIMLIAFAAFVSCSESDKAMLKGKAFDSLTDKAFNSSSSKNSSDSGSGYSTSGKGAKAKGKYSGRATGDDHYVDEDVVFVSANPFSGSGYIWISPATVMKAPSAETKNEGQYMIIQSGEEMWTKNAWKTVIASESDLKVGMVVVFFAGREVDDVRQPPEDKEQAQAQHGWVMAKITDMSNKYRGYLTLSGGWKVAMEDFRIIVKK